MSDDDLCRMEGVTSRVLVRLEARGWVRHSQRMVGGGGRRARWRRHYKITTWGLNASRDLGLM
ncbi:hypothetical protein [Rhizohabitans arisaemae]|uniref:hypothetical protein n=1 Tax=Rhizohabitans arisaemae TaxID=2720610 RepID=UPI0024B0AF45|nr:hypothetical protein [Rhizohabitans arisaemae]